MTELTAQMSSGSGLIESTVFAVGNAKISTIKLQPEIKQSSKVNVVVFYITEDGEIISDSLTIDYENDLMNKVSAVILTKSLAFQALTLWGRTVFRAFF